MCLFRICFKVRESSQVPFIFIYIYMSPNHTNLHNSIEETSVSEVIYAFDRDQVAVDGWTLAFGQVSII